MVNYIKYVFIASVLISLMACGDDSTGPDLGEAPELPTVLNSEAQPDVSFFQDNQPKNSAITISETTNYYDAQTRATVNASFFGIGQVYSSFVMAAQQAEPDVQDGKWVWSYNYTYEGQSAEFRLTAEEVSNGYAWEMFLSFDDGQGTSVEDYKVMEGITSEDGTEGEWTFNTLNPDGGEEIVAFTSTWRVDSDTEKQNRIEIYDDSGTIETTGLYEQNTPEFKMTFTYPDSEDVIEWNTETNEGYIQQGSDKKCWDDQFQNVPCS